LRKCPFCGYSAAVDHSKAIRKPSKPHAKINDQLAMRAAVIRAVRQHPGILQTDLWELLDEFPTQQLQSVVYRAAQEAVIVREKRGNTFALWRPKA